MWLVFALVCLSYSMYLPLSFDSCFCRKIELRIDCLIDDMLSHGQSGWLSKLNQVGGRVRAVRCRSRQGKRGRKGCNVVFFASILVHDEKEKTLRRQRRIIMIHAGERGTERREILTGSSYCSFVALYAMGFVGNG